LKTAGGDFFDSHCIEMYAAPVYSEQTNIYD